MTDSKVDVVLMRLEEHIGTGFSHIPDKIRRWGMNNILQASLSFLFAWKDDNTTVKVRATDAGAIKVASVGAGLSRVDVKTGYANQTESAALVFDSQAQRLEVTLTDYNMWIRLSPDGVTWGDQILCIADRTTVLDIATLAVKVQAYAISAAGYAIVGEW